jgi:hypothetical protein
MDIDKIWVEENIDELMNVFVKMNPEFKSNENGSRAAKSRHKKKMLQNMDTTMYRPIYHIARFTKIKEMKLRKIIREQNTEFSELEDINHANAENLQLYKEKSCKLEIENMKLKKRIEELEKNIQNNK